MLATWLRGEMRSCTTRTAGSRSSPYSARRRSRRYGAVDSRKVGRLEIPTMSTADRMRAG